MKLLSTHLFDGQTIVNYYKTIVNYYETIVNQILALFKPPIYKTRIWDFKSDLKQKFVDFLYRQIFINQDFIFLNKCPSRIS